MIDVVEEKKISKNYFSEEVQEAIISYNISESLKEKNNLYVKIIYPAFDKLSENLIHTYKFYKTGEEYEDLKYSVISFLTERLPKYTESNGKAFSYFTKVGFNFLINTTNLSLTKSYNKAELEEIDASRDLLYEKKRESYLDSLSDFITLWVSDVDSRLYKLFKNKRDLEIADSILVIFIMKDEIEFLNKKHIYVLIKERVSKEIKTQTITKIISKLKEDFYKKFDKYLKNGSL